MNCLSCENKLSNADKEPYHAMCAKKLFGAAWVPSIDLTYRELATEAKKLVGRISISGVQEKLSVTLNRKSKTLEVAPEGGRYILKPSPAHFPHLAENENLCMNLAGEMAIETPSHGLIKLKDGNLAYLVKRFDREKDIKLHVEYFAQLLGKKDKYDGSLEQIGSFLMRRSEIPFIDAQKLFCRALFYYLIGNGDAHLKNFAMICLPDLGYRLSLAYDIASSRLAMSDESDELALTLSGKRNNIALNDIKKFANYLEISEKNYNRFIESARHLKTVFDSYLDRSFLPEKYKNNFRKIFQSRLGSIFK